MGSCGSVHRKSEADMKFNLSFGGKADKVAIPPSAFKEKPNNGNFRIGGSKEEAFFDSKPWLDSDGEDDFHSVKGEFTPSRGSTPIHHSFGNSSVNKTPSVTSLLPEPSQTEKKKKLLELFRERVGDDKEAHDHDDKNTSHTQIIGNVQDLLPKSAQSTPYISGANSACSSERTMNEDSLSIKEKQVKSVQCCLPSLASCRSFSERRRKMSPAIAANGKP
ncbi:uncharacterized protein G2W53_040793 [Senna tora]|uniref:Uncharacterized protein n=1 Tax=Senna tora TaxID=362788 RepID=A0A834VY86_9FABA|nr:uncharacterized protein G2W53_040793 [Senna tora]